MEFILWPIFGLMEVVAALLWPSKDAKTRRLQRIALVIALLGLLMLILSIVLLVKSTFSSAAVAFTGAFILLVSGGELGQHIEKRCKREQSETTNT